MLPQVGFGRTPFSGVLMLAIWFAFVPFDSTTSKCSPRFGPSSLDSPRLSPTDSGCSIRSSVILTLLERVATCSGVRPPYGSGYGGFRMLMLRCRYVLTSFRRVPANTLPKYRPAATRATVRPSPWMSHARPNRGPQLLVSFRDV